ncbi:MAG TPA: hypothetical protein VF753_18960 [Terriglobales bacterium]
MKTRLYFFVTKTDKKQELSKNEAAKPATSKESKAAAGALDDLSKVEGAEAIAKLPGPVARKVVKVIENNAFGIVVHAVAKAKEGDFHAMKLVFDVLERFEQQAPPEDGDSLSKVLLYHLGLNEEMIKAEQCAVENGEELDDPLVQKLAAQSGIK